MPEGSKGRKIPQKDRLKPKEGYNIITIYDGKGNEVRQRYAKRKGVIQSVKEMISDKPGSGDATGKGGRRRERKVMDAVDEAVEGSS